MTRLRSLSFLVLLASCAAAAAQPAPPANPEPLTPSDYLRELEHWSGVVDSVETGKPDSAALESLPAQWRVRWGTQESSVDTAWLRNGLDIVAKNPSQAEATRGRLRARLQALRTEAQALQPEGPPVDLSEARSSLNEILSRREFAGVRGPNWWDELRWRINQAIRDLLAWLFRGVAGVPYAGEILLWGIIALLLSVLAIWLKRYWLRPGTELEAEIEAAPVVRDWSELARRAAAAAERGDYRQALHWAYWATVYRLENLGVWTVDRSRTPREYLRLLPARDARQPVLVAVTRRVENVWYGGESATKEDFQDIVVRVESLGCLFPWNPEIRKS